MGKCVALFHFRPSAIAQDKLRRKSQVKHLLHFREGGNLKTVVQTLKTSPIWERSLKGKEGNENNFKQTYKSRTT